MEDELGGGSGAGGGVSESTLSGNSHGETSVENDDTGCGDQVGESYGEGDDGGEIMVEIVGSDVFVDGVSGNEEGDLRPAETGEENKAGEMELGLPKSKDETNHVFSEALGVSGEEGEDETRKSELGSPDIVDTSANMIMETDLVSADSNGENNIVGTDENKITECELGLPESNAEKSNVVTSEKEMGESEPGLAEPKDGKINVFTEAMGVAGETKIGKSEPGFPELSDEKGYVVTEAMDVCSEGVENQTGESEVGLPKSKEGNINYIVTEAIDVLDEVSENKVGGSELGVLEQKGEKENHVIIAEEIDCTFNVPVNVEVGILPVQTEEAVVTTQMEISENKTIKGEAAFEKEDPHDSQIVSSKVSLCPNSEGPVNVEGDGVDSATVTVQVVFLEEETIKDETIDEKATKYQDHLGLDSHDSEISPSEVSPNPNGEGPESEKSQVDGINSVIVTTQTSISEGITVKDETVNEKTRKDPNQDSCDGERPENVRVDGFDNVVGEEAKIFYEKEGFAAESKDLVVKSDGLDSNDSHVTEFESNHEKGTLEEVDAVPGFKDGGSDVNPQDLSCVGNDESLKSDGDMEMDMVHQNGVVPNDEEPSQPAYGFDTDVVNKDESEKVLEGGGLSENVEKIVSEESKQPLECQENDEIPNGVEKCCLSESKEQDEVSVIISEASDHLVDGLDNTDLIPSEVVSVDPVSNTTQANILPEISEKSEFEFPFDSNTVSLGEIDRNTGSEAVEDNSEIGNEESSNEAKKLKLPDEEATESEVYLKMSQPGYFPPPETEGHFSVSDLVWGKVRSHPWWPGQIFDPADASEKAVKHYKNDSYLVAYFGDKTFAWNESSLLKPFRTNFSQIEKQCNSEAFQNAVDSALEEVSRRVELGLACSCIPNDFFCKIKAQIVENTGVREESSNRYGLGHSTGASSFEPDKFLEYIRNLAPVALSRTDRLDLAIARSQLLSFNRFKGYRPLTEFLEIDDEKITGDEIITASHKRKYVPKDSLDSRKERSLMELMGPDGEYSLEAEEDETFGKKQKSLDPLISDGYDKSVNIYAAKVSTLTGQNTPKNKPSFKIGECIRRVASQLTGSTGKDDMIIDDSKKNPERRSMVLSIESFSVDEMLSQLERVSQQPMKRHDFLNVIHTFFMGFRSSIALNRRGRKRRPEQTAPGGSAEGFEFDDVSDSYWTDRIVQNYSELNVPVGNHQVVPIPLEKPAKPSRRVNSKKRFSGVMVDSEIDEQVKRKKQASSPAELILNFAEKSCIPTEINLNKMFRRFGPLMESETEVDHNSGCAKVIFKRGSDAEVARNSSEAFNVFGSVLVNYHIGYEPVVSVRVSPMTILMPQEDMILMQ